MDVTMFSHVQYYTFKSEVLGGKNSPFTTRRVFAFLTIGKGGSCRASGFFVPKVDCSIEKCVRYGEVYDAYLLMRTFFPAQAAAREARSRRGVQRDLQAAPGSRAAHHRLAPRPAGESPITCPL